MNNKSNPKPATCPMMGGETSVTQFERVPEDEAAKIEKIARLTPQLQNKRIGLPGNKGRVLRGVHPKSHGCLEAEFIINPDIQKDYQVGLFAKPGNQYKAHIRFSNAAVEIDPDSKYVLAQEGVPAKWEHGSRGMAIKVYDVNGEVIDLDQNNQKTQDFLMINTPEFAFSDVRSYLFLTFSLFKSEFGNDSTTLFALGQITLKHIMKANRMPTQVDFELLKHFLASEKNVAKFEMPDGFMLEDLQRVIATLFLIAGKIQRQVVRNPLQVQYFGASPYLFGPDRVMKFSAAPVEPVLQNEFGLDPVEEMSDDYLKEAIDKSMQGDTDIVFDFKVLLKEGDFGENNQLIEDATTTWKKDGIEEVDQYQNVAKLIIKPPQDGMPEAKCENLVFTPWHCLTEHQPIGSINRLRRSVYSNSASHRKHHS